MPETNVNDFIDELGAGVIKQKLALILSEAALGAIHHGTAKKKAKVTLELTLVQVGENEQVIISHKFSHVIPTARGKKAEDSTAETPMFVGRGGVLTVSPPKEDDNGQFNLNREKTGIHQIK